jgi:hypothetical protein
MSEENVLLRVRPTRLNTTRPQRALYEQVFIRFPGLVRALSLLRLRLPMRSRLRRFLLLRFAELASAAANRQDFDLLFTGFDPELDLRTAADVYPTELSGHHYGHSGYRDLWGKLLDVWEYVRIEPVSMTFFQVFTFRAGLIVRQEDVQERAEALEAAGLSE